MVNYEVSGWVSYEQIFGLESEKITVMKSTSFDTLLIGVDNGSLRNAWKYSDSHLQVYRLRRAFSNLGTTTSNRSSSSITLAEQVSPCYFTFLCFLGYLVTFRSF